MMSSEKTNNSRRDFLVKSMALIPTVVIGGAGAGAIGVATSATAQAAPASRASLREHRGGQRLEAAVLQRS